MSFDDNPVIARLREQRQTLNAMIAQRAKEAYDTFDKNERTVLQFGMFPHDKMRTAQSALIAELTEHDGEEPDHVEIARLLAVAIMDCANRGTQPLVV